jgi:hypothetical protein
MSHWHLTLGEPAFLAPAGVVLGAVVSYLAMSRTTAATLRVQRLAIEEDRDRAAEQRRAELGREERDHRRAAYAELGGHLQGVFDALNYIVGPVLQTSTASESDWSGSASTNGWSGFYAQVLDAVPDCRRLAAVYGSAEVRAAVGALGAIARALAPPASFKDSPRHWMHAMTQHDGGIATELITLQDGNELRSAMVGNIQIAQAITGYGLAQIRHELLPSSITTPPRLAGVAADPNLGAYVVARPAAASDLPHDFTGQDGVRAHCPRPRVADGVARRPRRPR